MKKEQRQEKQIQKILSELSAIQQEDTDEKIENILNNVMHELECLVWNLRTGGKRYGIWRIIK